MNWNRRWRNRCLLLVLNCLLVSSAPKSAWAYRPQSPEVQALVERGIKYIEANYGKNTQDNELGAVCICALACFSHTANPDHPLVKQAIVQIRKEIQEGMQHHSHGNYSLGIAMILLGSVDPGMYRQEMQALLDVAYRRQMPGGGWSYPGHATGDTSQTQFACLGMWMAYRRGIDVSIPSVEKVTNWLIRTQAPDGAFGYQGNDPGGGERIPQERTTPSMGVAGTGTLYVCAELLGFIQPAQEKSNLNLPTALKQSTKKKKGPITAAVDGSKLREAINMGDNWTSRNSAAENNIQGTVTQQYYYMYTVERYWAFRDLASVNVNPEPAWYNAGVDLLRKRIEKDGSWVSGNGASVDTAFAVLFLLRSSMRTIQKIIEESGVLRGGKTLPTDLTDLKQDRNGKIVAATETPIVEDLLSMLESKDTPLTEFLDGMPDQLQLAADPAKRAAQITRLRRMAISGPFQSRLTAVQTLSRQRDLDSAPALIYAITDTDPRICRAAAIGLRFYSRKFDGPVPTEKATDLEKKAISEIWKQWYLSIRPDGTLIE